MTNIVLESTIKNYSDEFYLVVILIGSSIGASNFASMVARTMCAAVSLPGVSNSCV